MPAKRIARRLGIANAARTYTPLSWAGCLRSLVTLHVGIGLFLFLATYYLRAAPGGVKWTYTPPDADSRIIYSSPAIGKDGTIYVSIFLDLKEAKGPSTRLYALDPEANPERVTWWREIGATNYYASPAIGVGGIVYVSALGTKVWAINPDGSRRWEFTTGGLVSSSPAVGADGTIYIGSEDQQVYAIDGDTGKTHWGFATGGPVSSSPAVGGDGTVYVGSRDGNLYALDGTTGTSKWAAPFRTGAGVESSPAIGGDGTIYVGSGDKNVYAIDPSGIQKWVFGTADKVSSSPAISADGATIYVGSDDARLYAIDSVTHAQRWAFLTGGPVRSSPAIGADGTIYVGSYDRYFYAVNAGGGTNAGVPALELVHSSPAIGPDGTVYFGSRDGSLYAVEGFDPRGLAPSLWPKFRRNAKNSGGLATLGIHRLTNRVEVITLAGSGAAGWGDGYGTNTQFSGPKGSFFDPRNRGTNYVADAVNQCVRGVRSDGMMVWTIAGSQTGVKGHRDGPGISALFDGPIGLCVDGVGNIYVVETNNYIRKIDTAGNVTTLAGIGLAGHVNGALSVARFDFPNAVALGADGALYVADFHNHTIRRVPLDGSDVSDWVGNGNAGYVDGVGSGASLDQPSGLAADRQGNLFFTEWHGQRVRRADPSGKVTTVAGSDEVADPESGYVDGTGLFSRFHNPAAIAVDAAGNLFIAENQNFTVRRITPAGVVETVAGTGIHGFQDGDGAAARFSDLAGIGTDDKGNLYVTEGGNNRVRKITIYEPPKITSQPRSITVVKDGTATFQVEAAGTPLLTYQWWKDGVFRRGATNYVLTIDSARTNDAGSYVVTVANGAGVVDSQAAVLTVLEPPVITDRPRNLTVNEGDPVTFSVTATGTPPLTYQWTKNGTNIPGALTNVFLIAHAQTNDAGSYAVTVSNAADSATTKAVKLTVNVPPTILTQPLGITVVENGTASFQVEATGAPPLSYQWLKDGTAIVGASNAVLTITNAQAADAGRYVVRVANGAGAADSQVAVLTVLVPPVITDRPRNLTVNEGDPVTFSVTATGTPPLSYQWAKNGTNIPGALTNVFLIAHAQTNDAGNYSVTVSNAADSATTKAVKLTVNVPPSILTQPHDMAVTNGGFARFDVEATGAEPLSYQWSKDGTAITGADNAALTLINVQPGNAGNYTVRVANNAGSATSQVARLTVLVPPAITAQPQDLVVTNGASASFSVDVNGTEPFTFQWLRNGGMIRGAAGKVYTINGATTNDAGSYSVIVTNGAGSVTSRAALLTVNVPPAITLQPQSVTVLEGDNAAFRVSASGTEPLSYQWLKDGTAITGAGNAALTLTNVQPGNAGNYTVRVANNAGSATSQVARLTVLVPPTITAQPQDLAVTNGASASFSVDVNGTEPFTFQWLRSGGMIRGAAGKVYTINGATTNDAGNYSVIVTNGAGSVTSRAALLTVNVPPTITLQPQSVTVLEGDNAAFRVSASGTEPLSYQWSKDGAGIPSATAASFAITNVLATDAGRYTVLISNLAGTVRSEEAKLTVTLVPKVTPPVITSIPVGQTVTNGDPASFSVTATGTPPFVYQWFKDGEALAGQAGPQCQIPRVQLSDAGAYYVVVGNAAGSATSAPPARLSVYAFASLRGQATDALNKKPMAGVTVRLGNLSRITGPDGSFYFTNVPPGGLAADFTANPTQGAAPLRVSFTNTSTDGAYTLEAEKTGYSRYAYAPVELASGEEKEWNFSLSPSLEGLRLVLNWGRLPLDLDAHLLTPKINGVNYHVQYATRYLGQTNRPPYAQLDIDATDGFGPETITIASNIAGIYRYYVRNYKEDQGNTGELTNSAAVVQIYATAGLIQTVTVPPLGQGDYWDVCAIAGGNITVINQIVSTAPLPDTAGGSGPVGGGSGESPTVPTFAWSFGDGQTSEFEDPVNTYTRPGAYPVSLRVTLPDGRSASVTKPQYLLVTPSTTTAPTLTVALAAGDVVLSWQTGDPGFVLEYRTSLASGAWTPVSSAPQPGPDNTYTVRIPLTGRECYFRLRK